mmetsp:Transcript_18986/g.19724  ORF Transcript_18986/g.19724 Transcript_18986/m.19724 type:complete len:540 (+) Transcript_18986:38-1657(+)|eukprot:CAMPEP_0174821626 /NCGR_PEP_ID=MMETSP1107-20130205/9132_1 /TAXON_ID=36770 /ORGANISM="Paraphysomonas vestita, Strain GFlagA" /LENGTH=539 /DNA_ID=CAMNT_0016038873 /DNA_START=20 /DNA_END=1639 /DNA_ORIENTATION=+
MSGLDKLKDILGEALSDDAAYRFKYPSNFGVSSTVHQEDLPPLSWIAEVAKRLGLNATADVIPNFLRPLFGHDTSEPVDRNVDDETVAASQVAGFNPLVLRKASLRDKPYLLERFPEINSYVFNDGDNFPAALLDNRIFITDYGALSTIKQSNLNPQKQLYFPIGIFRIPLNNPKQSLDIVAIKIGQNQADPVYRPGDQQWTQAKIAFNCADGNYHELISHLGRTHLLIEPFVVSTPRVFLDNHWVRRLLSPHFCGTATINALAFKALINTGGTLDQLLCGDLDSELEVSYQSIQEPGFKSLMLPTYLAERELLDPRLLYPYRDDATDVWNAIRSWVTSFASIHCENDEAVQSDIYIRNWVNDVSIGGKVAGLGEITTLSYLIDVLTMIIFTASAQHAAVNFSQADQMDDGKTVPLAIYGDVTTATVKDILPPKDMLTLQMNVANLLGGVYFTKLGDYVEYGPHAYASVKPNDSDDNLVFSNNNLVFNDPREIEALESFRHALNQVRANIVKRNRECPFRQTFKYWYLHPDNIPQSINI